MRALNSHWTIAPIRRRLESAMPNLWPTLLLLVILCASAAIGFFVHSHLPEQHRSAQSIGLVQLVIGLLVTFIAIVLGLLTTSVKAGFDTAYNARGHYAGELAQMDRCLRDYGPETAPIREQLRAYVAAVIASTWPNEPPPANVSYPDASKMARTGENPVLASLMNDVGLKTRSLLPPDPVHQSLMAACVQDYHDLIEARWAVIEGLRMRGKGRTPLLLLAAAVIGFAPRMSAAESQAPDASVQEASFEQHCAACHAIPHDPCAHSLVDARDGAEFHRRGADQRHDESAGLGADVRGARGAGRVSDGP